MNIVCSLGYIHNDVMAQNSNDVYVIYALNSVCLGCVHYKTTQVGHLC